MQRYFNAEADVAALIYKVRRFFEKRGYDVKLVSSDILQASKSSTIRKISGLSSGLRVTVTLRRGQTVVDMSGDTEEYILKAVVGFVAGIFSAGFLALVPAWGALEQYKLGKATGEEIDDYFNDLIVRAEEPTRARLPQ